MCSEECAQDFKAQEEGLIYAQVLAHYDLTIPLLWAPDGAGGEK